jgi:hypothetical protein
VPTIFVVRNIATRVYPNDHPPAHFHLISSGFHAKVAIDGLTILETTTSEKNLRPALDWAAENLETLREAWKRYHD